MSMIYRYVLLAAFLAATPSVAQISTYDSRVSLLLDVGFHNPVSAAMNGTAEEFYREVSQDNSPSRYPFGDGDARKFLAGGHLAYRFPESPISLFAGVQRSIFIGYGTNGGQAKLRLWTVTLGGEYSFGDALDRWNGFGRGGINGSLFDGRIIHPGDPPFHSWIPGPTTLVDRAVRYGNEAEAGARYNLKFSPVSIEASVNYTNANLIGKEYQAPQASRLEWSSTTSLNDGADPLDPADRPRTIDYVTLRVGVRIRL